MKKAIIPAAGYGTRLLPITRVIPKVMIPVLTKPILHYVIDELYGAGIRDILLVVGWKKEVISDYWEYKRDDMVKWLEEHAKYEFIEKIKNIKPKELNITYIEQKILNGLAGAILLGREFVGNDNFAVALADNVIIEEEAGSLLREMIQAHEKFDAKVTLAVAEVPDHLVSKFGIVGIKDEIKEGGAKVFEVDKVIEKPSLEEAPSNYAILGRYVLSPLALDYLERAPVIKGEISETEAFQAMANDGHKVIALDVGKRRWYDVGILEGYAKAFIDLLLFAETKDVPKELKEKIINWLKELLEEHYSVIKC